MTPEQRLIQLQKWKTTQPKPAERLGVEVVDYFKHSIEKKQKKFGHIGEAWLARTPPELQTFAELSTLVRGTLTIVVQGASNLYLLKQALLNGLQDQLLHDCRSDGLKKIVVRAGKISG